MDKEEGNGIQRTVEMSLKETKLGIYDDLLTC